MLFASLSERTSIRLSTLPLKRDYSNLFLGLTQTLFFLCPSCLSWTIAFALSASVPPASYLISATVPCLRTPRTLRGCSARLTGETVVGSLARMALTGGVGRPPRGVSGDRSRNQKTPPGEKEESINARLVSPRRRYDPAAIPVLRRAQRKIAQHPSRFKVVACGRRWGKTTLGMALAVGYALDGYRVWWVAPTYGLAFHPWRAFKRRLAGLWEQKIETDRHIDLKSGGSITVKTAEYPDGLRGVGVDFLVVDEAAFVDEEVWTSCLRPALSDTEGGALILSTPRSRNWFYQVYQLGTDEEASEWQSWTFKTIDNPRIKPGEVDEARRRLPDRIFRQEYLAEFLEDGGEVFRGLMKASVASYVSGPVPGHRYVMGVDFGRYVDFTACVVIDTHDKTMVTIDRFTDAAWNLQLQRITNLARKWQPESILVEANAMGDPNIETLINQGLPITRFLTTAASKPPLIENLVSAIENVDLAILPDADLLRELGAYKYRTSRTGHTVYEAPFGLHDDTVIALALAWKLASTPRIMFGIVSEDGWKIWS